MTPLYRLLFNLDMKLTSLTSKLLNFLTRTKYPNWSSYKPECKLRPLDIFECLGGLEYVSIFVRVSDVYIRTCERGYELEFLYRGNGGGGVRKMRIRVEEFEVEILPIPTVKAIGVFFMTVGMWSLKPFDKTEFTTVLADSNLDELVDDFEKCTDMRIRF